MLISVFNCLKTVLCNILHTCTSMFARGSNWMSGFPLCKLLVNHKMYKIRNMGEIVDQAAVPSSTTDPSQALNFVIYLHHLPGYISLKVKLQQIKYPKSYPQGIVSHCFTIFSRHLLNLSFYNNHQTQNSKRLIL